MSVARWALAGTILAAGVWLATRASAEPPFVPFPPSLGTLGPMGGGGGGGGGTITGGGASPQVAFWTGATAIAGDAGLTYNAGTDALTLAGDFLYAGRLAATVRQVGTCVAGVLALNPTEAYVDIDPSGAACVVTIAETSAILGTDVTISITRSAGAGTVTFPDVAGVHNGPTLCTITGLIIDGVYTITYVDKANDTFLGKACVQN